MFSGVPNSHLYTAYKIVSTFLLADGITTKPTSGTGFFIRNQRNEICLLSNRHMFDAGYEKPVGKYFGAKLQSVRVEGFRSNGNIDAVPTTRVETYVALNLSSPVFAPNYDEDVACFFNPKVLTVDGSVPQIDFFLQDTELATDEWIEQNMSVCDFVAFPGFPPWYDQFGKRPILRSGTISSDPRTNYSNSPTEKGRRIAYEAFSFGGSSGSPVFATQKGFKGGAGLVVTGYREGRLVGINAGHYKDDAGSHSGVSYFFKSSVILELVNGNG